MMLKGCARGLCLSVIFLAVRGAAELRCRAPGGPPTCLDSWRSQPLGDFDRFVLGVVEGDAEDCARGAEDAASLEALTCGAPARHAMELLHVALLFGQLCLGDASPRPAACEFASVLAEAREAYRLHKPSAGLIVADVQPVVVASLQRFVDEHASTLWPVTVKLGVMDAPEPSPGELYRRLVSVALELGYARRVLQWRTNALLAVAGYGLARYVPRMRLTDRYHPSRLEVLLELLGGPTCSAEDAHNTCIHAGGLRFAEVGVHLGRLSFPIMSFLPALQYIGVDPYSYESSTPEASVEQQLKDLHHENADELSEARDAAEEKFRFFGPRAELWVMTSEEAAETLPDASIDGVFIDGDHSYDAVRRDLAVWEPKLRSGGFLSGHDFGNHPDVATAVLEHAERHNRTVNLAMDWVWYWRLP